MNVIQLCQILFVALIGAFALVVAVNNLRDPRSNLRLVEHLMSMDSVFPDTRLKSRAILSPAAHRAAFGVIVALEAATAALCLYGAGVLIAVLGAPSAASWWSGASGSRAGSPSNGAAGNRRSCSTPRSASSSLPCSIKPD
jgi:predicted small integral membrane protein